MLPDFLETGPIAFLEQLFTGDVFAHYSQIPFASLVQLSRAMASRTAT